MKRYRQAVSAVVLRPSSVCSPDGCTQIHSILLVHKPRKRDAWQIPQGGIEEGESPEQAALRELKEETGLTLSCDVHRSIHTYTYDFPAEFVRRHHPYNDGQTLTFVVMEAPESCMVTVDRNEIDSSVWVLPEQLPEYIKRQEYLDIILNVLAEYRGKKQGA